MPKLSELEAGPLANEKWAMNIEFGTCEGVCKLFNFMIDEMRDYIMFPIIGLQNALVAENHEMRLLESVDRSAQCVRPQHQHR